MSHDRKVAVVLMIFAIVVFIQGKLIPAAGMQREIGAGAFVLFLAALLFLLSIALYMTAGKKKKKAKPEGVEHVASSTEIIVESGRARVIRILKAVLVIGVYIVALPYLGFIAATVLFGIVYLTYIYGYKFLKSIFPAAAMAFLGYLIFKVALQIPLPMFMEAIR
jgi:hypothetical protein